MNNRERLAVVAAEVSRLTKEKLHSYTANPGDGAPRVVFSNSKVCLGYAEAVAHACTVLEYLRERGVSETWKWDTRGL